MHQPTTQRIDLAPPRQANPPTAGTRGPRRPWWRAWLRTPLATVLWIAVIVWCFAMLPRSYSMWPAGAPTVSGGAVIVPTCSIVRRGGSVTAVDCDKVRPSDASIGMAWFDYRLRPEFEGRWITMSEAISAADRPAARAAYITWLGGHPERYWRNVASRLKAADEVNTAGYLGRRIALAIVAFVAFILACYSLVWTLPILTAIAEPLANLSTDPEERERRRRRKRLAAGRCPGCGYAIAGLPQHRCPECNETWSASELRT